MEASEATLQRLFLQAAPTNALGLAEFRQLWNVLELPLLPGHLANVTRAFETISGGTGKALTFKEFQMNLRPLLELVKTMEEGASLAQRRSRGSTSSSASPLAGSRPNSTGAFSAGANSAGPVPRVALRRRLSTASATSNASEEDNSEVSGTRVRSPRAQSHLFDEPNSPDLDMYAAMIRKSTSPATTVAAYSASGDQLRLSSGDVEEELLELRGEKLSLLAEVDHLRSKLRAMEKTNKSTIETAEEELVDAEKELHQARANLTKMKKDLESAINTANAHKSIIQDIYDDPYHEAHAAHLERHADATSARVQQLMREKMQLKEENERLNAEIHDAIDSSNKEGSAAAEQTIAELQNMVESLREDFLASNDINTKLGLELQNLRDYANKVKDRNDELEQEITNKFRGPTSESSHGPVHSLASELGELDVTRQSYDSQMRDQLEVSMRSTESAESTADRELQRELERKQADILRLTSEKAALVKQLEDSAMTDAEIDKFRGLKADLEALHKELQSEQNNSDAALRENAALRFMYKELQRTSVSPTRYQSVREKYLRLTSAYDGSKNYIEELEATINALQFQVETMSMQIQHGRKDSLLNTPTPFNSSLPARGSISAGITEEAKLETEHTFETVIHSLQAQLQEGKSHAEIQEWKLRTAIGESDRLKVELAEVQEQLKASEKAREEAVTMLDRTAGTNDAQQTQRKQDHQDDTTRKLYELEAQLRAERRSNQAYAEEKRRIHKDAMMMAQRKMEKLEREVKRLEIKCGENSERHGSRRRRSTGHSDLQPALVGSPPASPRSYPRSPQRRQKMKDSNETVAKRKGSGTSFGQPYASEGRTAHVAPENASKHSSALPVLDELLVSTSIRHKMAEVNSEEKPTTISDSQNFSASQGSSLDDLLRNTSIRHKVGKSIHIP